MKFRMQCAWCQNIMCESEYPETKYSHILQRDGIITSHGICEQCKIVVKRSYKSPLNKLVKHSNKNKTLLLAS